VNLDYNEPLLTTRELADTLGVPANLVRSWASRRKITPAAYALGVGSGPSSVPLYRLSEVRPIAERYKPRHADRTPP
jgi:hypothetical protein